MWTFFVITLHAIGEGEPRENTLKNKTTEKKNITNKIVTDVKTFSSFIALVIELLLEREIYF
jgi:hypothetical protein